MQTYSQELSPSQLDSLYNKFIQLRAPELLPQTDQPAELTLEDRKCGFGLISQIEQNLERLTPEQQRQLSKVLQRKVKQTSLVSPSGFFRIHYDSTGSQVPKYNPALSAAENAWQVALSADSAYNFEVNFLGYPQPPADNGEGGDDRYDIYITAADGMYGFTKQETPLGDERYTSFIEIHYSFTNFYTKGLAAMRVTVAHELHHAIQMGNYILRWDDTYFYELTSTAMEEFVYDDVNDYYGYIPDYFNNPERAFPSNSGYNLAHWNIYLQQNFDYDIIKRQWELMSTQRAILAIGNSILERGSTFAREYNRFGLWTYYTGYRAIPNKFFEEAVFYPAIKPLTKIPFNNSYPPIVVDAQLTSNNFIQFNINPGGDTLFAVITNGNLSSTVSSPNQSSNFKYTLFANATSGERKLTENYSANFEVTNPGWWSVSEILNGLIVREDSAVIPGVNVEESFVFPNPFRYNGNVSVSIEGKQGEELSFNVYSSDMSLVYSVQKPANILLNNTIGISWNGLDNNGNRLGSGVYIYVVKHAEKVVTGKVVIFNE